MSAVTSAALAHRGLAFLSATALALGGLGLAASGATAAPGGVLPADAEQISSGQLRVTVSKSFPQALSYTEVSSRKLLSGASSITQQITINGVDQPVTVSSKKIDARTMEYELTPSKLSGVSLSARLTVQAKTVSFNITKIVDTPENRVNNLQIKNQDLVTVSSKDPQASVASAVVSVNRAVSGDTITAINASTPLDASAKSAKLSLASNGQLAAGFENNSLYDSGSPSAPSERGKFWRQAVSDGAGGVKMGISSGAWLYRANGSEQTEELPWSKVIITGDANSDGKVDWQDGAIAYRGIETKPAGGADVKNRVITHIPFNFASQATHPFLKTLDDVKHISLATDGLGQMALLKGYTSEGHDSANSDFGGNYNTRAGGLGDLNQLLQGGAAYGATFGVHINNTEAYPEANSFNDGFVDKTKKGWNWLDQSYYIDQQKDILSGSQNARVQQLRTETSANLTMTYVDVFYESGWKSYRLQKSLSDAGFSVASEFGTAMTANNTWSHWANDENYGGSDNKGWNSQILRFVDNSQRDIWNPDPLLGTSHIVEWEGWTGQNDYNAFLKNVWNNNVPVKFLQQQEITSWTPGNISLTGGLSINGTSLADRVISQNGVAVLKGNDYLLPWSAAPVKFGPGAKNSTQQNKLYHYSLKGGSTNWQLTPDFANADHLLQYKLTDTGRELVGSVPVVNGQVTLSSAANQAYVLVPEGTRKTVPAVKYGVGTPIQDPGFDANTLKAWKPTGGAAVQRTAKGLLVAKLGQDASSISQTLQPVQQAGTYSVSAWLEIEPGKKRATTLSVTPSGGKPVSVIVESSGAKNQVAADDKSGSYFQRIRVLVDLRPGQTAKLSISAGAGDAAVRIDDVRMVKTVRVPTSGVLSEDFEGVDQGWGPFVKGDAGGVTDPRTHIAKLNAPYTQSGWNAKTTSDTLAGQYSLHSHEENQGLVYRTSNYTLPLQPGHQYKVSFDYQSSLANQYAWVSGYDNGGSTVQTSSNAIPVATETTRWNQTFTASGCGPNWVGLSRTGSSDGAEFTLDNFLVEDLGASSETPACASLSMVSNQPVIEQGTENSFSTTFKSTEAAPISNLSVALKLPEGWTAIASTPATAATLPSGGTLTTQWRVKVPASADGNYSVQANAGYSTTVAPLGQRNASAEAKVYTLPQPPSKNTYASDMQWIGTPSNGWGPLEKDQANGEQGEGDGPPLTLGGKVYAKGLGAHAASNVRYYLGAQCTTFSSVIGIDDIQKTKGAVEFSVVGDGKVLYTSPTLKGGGTPVSINVPLSGVKYVDLKVGFSTPTNGNDWADWADAQFKCGS